MGDRSLAVGEATAIVGRLRKGSRWDVGFSARNNNEASKHSRLSTNSDFGLKWLGIPCSNGYWNTVLPIFERLQTLRRQGVRWADLEQKHQTFYVPILMAFRDELLQINDLHPDIPQKLIDYVIGKYPFYKIIRDDAHNLVIVKAFNLNGLLGKQVNKKRSRYGTQRLNYPKRIVEFELKENSHTTLNMILDQGWEIAFRIHSADTIVEDSLKFDIRLTGNPPILFTQHIFQD